jgi:hypothetical protein
MEREDGPGVLFLLGLYGHIDSYDPTEPRKLNVPEEARRRENIARISFSDSGFLLVPDYFLK